MARTKHKRKPSRAASPSTASPKTRSSSADARMTKRTGGRAKQSQGTTTKKPHRYRPGMRALQEVRKYQKNTNPLIPRASFIREVRAISYNLAPEISRWQAEALVAIQDVRLRVDFRAAEDYLVQLFGDAMLCAIHAKRVTLSEFKKWRDCLYKLLSKEMDDSKDH